MHEDHPETECPGNLFGPAMVDVGDYYTFNQPDTQLLAALHNAFPALASELEAARKVVDELCQDHKWLAGSLNIRTCQGCLAEQRIALLDALRNQGLLQNTATGVIWHVHDCPASFDFAECNYRCRVAREAFALAGTEPYVSQETRRDTEVYE